jgi:hypothetical protein
MGNKLCCCCKNQQPCAISNLTCKSDCADDICVCCLVIKRSHVEDLFKKTNSGIIKEDHFDAKNTVQ